MQLPSVKVFSVALVALSAIVGLSFYTYKQHRQAALPFSMLAASSGVTLSALNDLDTDNDGLKDWEEALWGTDPENPDSDGDGTTDGAEVSANRNPTQTGDDAIRSGEIPQTPNYFENATSTTDAVAKQLFADYLALKSSGKLTSVTMESLVADATADIRAHTTLEPAYKKSALRIVVDSEASARAHKATFAAILQRFSPTAPGEFDYIYEAARNNFKGMEKIDPLIAEYKRALADFAAMEVPEGASGAHLAFINAFHAYVTQLAALRHALDDPIAAMIAAGSILSYEQEARAAFFNIAAFYGKWNV